MNYSTIPDRFYAKVNKNGPKQPHMDTPCWEWIGAATSCGYGSFLLNGKVVSAHIVAWILANGPVPEGMCVLHKCDYPLCVFLEHLFLGTKKDNTQDAISKGRHFFNDPPMLYGTKSPCAKVSEADAVKMRELRESGLLYREIASLFSISRSEARRIVLGERFNPNKIKGEHRT